MILRNILRSAAAVVFLATTAFCVSAQDLSNEVSIERQTGSDIVFKTSVSSPKSNSEAEELAIKSTINAILHNGIEGLHNGQPMLSEGRKDYDYRLFSTKRYANMMAGKVVKVDELKLNGIRKIVYEVPINIDALKRDAEKNLLSLSHAWADQKKEDPIKTAFNPVIVVLPEMNGDINSFEAMRALVSDDPAYKTAINKMTELFAEKGYTTRDFRTALENSKTDDLMRDGSQADIRTMIVQQLPGDIVVKLEIGTKQKGNTNSCNIGVRAVEKQTEAILASENFTSGYYHASDPTVLVNNALETVGPDFFSKLNSAFADMAKNGRRMNLDFNLSQTVSDWDFDSESPADGSEFRDELEEWLRSQAFQGIFDMSLSTDKYIKATINLPLWDNDKNRTYRITNFTSALKKFLKGKLGDEYKVNVAAMGQKLSIIIE